MERDNCIQMSKGDIACLCDESKFHGTEVIWTPTDDGRKAGRFESWPL